MRVSKHNKPTHRKINIPPNLKRQNRNLKENVNNYVKIIKVIKKGQNSKNKKLCKKNTDLKKKYNFSKYNY